MGKKQFKAKAGETIKREIDACILDNQRVGKRTHKVAMYVLVHYRAHGNTDLMSRMVNGLAKSGVYRQALLDWFKKHAGVQATLKGKEGEGIKLVPLPKKEFQRENIDCVKADDNPFYEKDTDGNANLPKFNAYKVLEQLLQKQEKAKENPEAFEKVELADEQDAAAIAGILQRRQQKSETLNPATDA